jgi:hypothetical protein
MIDKVPTGAIMHNRYFTTNILARLEDNYSQTEELRMQKD